MASLGEATFGQYPLFSYALGGGECPGPGLLLWQGLCWPTGASKRPWCDRLPRPAWHGVQTAPAILRCSPSQPARVIRFGSRPLSPSHWVVCPVPEYRFIPEEAMGIFSVSPKTP